MNTALTSTLGQLYQLLSSLNGGWMLMGTTSLFLLGYPIEPNDVDILCNSHTAAAIEDLLAAYRLPVDPHLSRDQFRSAFSRYELNGVTVEVMGDLEVNSRTGWVMLLNIIGEPQAVVFEQHTFLVPSRADQLSIYRLFNRTKDQPILQLLEQQ